MAPLTHPLRASPDRTARITHSSATPAASGRPACAIAANGATTRLVTGPAIDLGLTKTLSSSTRLAKGRFGEHGAGRDQSLAVSRIRRRTATDIPFESGIVPVGSPDKLRLSIEFYLVAIFFVIFDLETIFIFAWAIAFYDVGWPGYLGVAVFIAILIVALVYELSTGALDWGIKRRHERESYARLPEAA